VRRKNIEEGGCPSFKFMILLPNMEEKVSKGEEKVSKGERKLSLYCCTKPPPSFYARGCWHSLRHTKVVFGAVPENI